MIGLTDVVTVTVGEDHHQRQTAGVLRQIVAQLTTTHSGVDERVALCTANEKHLVIVGVADHAHAGRDFLRQIIGPVTALDAVGKGDRIAGGHALLDGHGAQRITGLQSLVTVINPADEEHFARVVNRRAGGRLAAIPGVVNLSVRDSILQRKGRRIEVSTGSGEDRGRRKLGTGGTGQSQHTEHTCELFHVSV